MSRQSDLRALAIKDAKNGDWQAAVTHNSELLEINPENTNALNRLGVAYIQLKKQKQAKEAFQAVLKIDKNNRIANKHLTKLKSKNGTVAPSFTQGHFLEEPGKTKTVPLFRLAGKDVLDTISVGNACELTIKSRYISVSVGDTYIGALPEDLSFRLSKLMKSGNEYHCLVRSCNGKECEVYLKETVQSKTNTGTHSFPPSKMSLTSLSEVEDTVVMEENIPVEIVNTDTDSEKTLDTVDTSDLD